MPSGGAVCDDVGDLCVLAAIRSQRWKMVKTKIMYTKRIAQMATLPLFVYLLLPEIDVYLPSFIQHSYIEYGGRLSSTLTTFTDIEIVFRPSSADGLLLYSGYTGERDADFISIALKHGHLEFRFSLGTGSTLIRLYIHFVTSWLSIELFSLRLFMVLPADVVRWRNVWVDHHETFTRLYPAILVFPYQVWTL